MNPPHCWRNFEACSPSIQSVHAVLGCFRWAYDKRLTYRLAADQQVDYPATTCPTNDSELETIACTFPAILKPATHATINRFTAQKAWRVATREELLARYREAKQMIPPDLILLQELIPGGGESQFSFAALCLDGKPIASLTARRTRQYPVDFGYSSSFVETLEVPEIVAPSQRLLGAMRYTGLVEVEYKYDARMAVTSFWTSIPGFGLGRRWVHERASIFLICFTR